MKLVKNMQKYGNVQKVAAEKKPNQNQLLYVIYMVRSTERDRKGLEVPRNIPACWRDIEKERQQRLAVPQQQHTAGGEMKRRCRLREREEREREMRRRRRDRER